MSTIRFTTDSGSRYSLTPLQTTSPTTKRLRKHLLAREDGGTIGRSGLTQVVCRVKYPPKVDESFCFTTEDGNLGHTTPVVTIE